MVKVEELMRGKFNFGSEWDALPYTSTQRLPLTSCIPYFYRWKILNLKLMLNDLLEIHKKHGVYTMALYNVVKKELSLLCDILSKEIKFKREYIDSIV